MAGELHGDAKFEGALDFTDVTDKSAALSELGAEPSSAALLAIAGNSTVTLSLTNITMSLAGLAATPLDASKLTNPGSSSSLVLSNLTLTLAGLGATPLAWASLTGVPAALTALGANSTTSLSLNHITPTFASLGTTPISAGQINSGTLNGARFPSTLPAVDGSALTNLNATSLASGTVAAARGGVGGVSGIVKANGTAASAAAPGTDYELPVYYVADGDSRTAPSGPAGTANWFSIVAGSADKSARIIAKNYGVGFKTVAQIVSGYSATGAASLSVSGGHQWSPAVTGAKGVYFVWAAINDLSAGTSATTILANLQTLYANARSDGYSAIVAFTETCTAVAGWNGTKETERVALNAALRALTLGGSNTPDYLIDADRIFAGGTVSFVGGGWGTWWNDTIHLNSVGSQLLGRIANAQINGGAVPYWPLIVLYSNGGGGTFTAGATTQIGQLVAMVDPANLFDLANNNVLCPIAGTVRVSVWFSHVVGATGDVWSLQVWATPWGGGAALKDYMALNVDAAAPGALQGNSSVIEFAVNAGDVLDFRIKGESGTLGWGIFNFISTRYTVQYLPAP